MKRSLTAAIAASGVLAVASSSSAAFESGTAEVRTAANEYARAQHGVLYFHVTTVSEMHGGPFARHDESSAAYVLENGTLAKKRYLSAVENRHKMNAAELAKKDSETEGPFTRLGMMVPYRASAVDDYTYDLPLRESSGVRVGFHAKVRDQAHGDGTMELDTNGHVERVTYTPAVLPEHAQTATVTIAFGEAGPGVWDVTRIERNFSGRRFFVSGSVESVSRYTDYRRYGNVEAGLAALAHDLPAGGRT